MNLASCLQASAQQYPERVAFIEEQQQLTYHQLDQAARALAQTLRAQGIGQGSRVGLILPNGLAYAIATYGVWYLGAEVVLINPQLTGPELLYILQDSAVVLAVIPEALLAPLHTISPELNTLVVGSPDWEKRLQALDTLLAPAECLPNATAAILYTSGTTGRPKGACLSHGNLEANSHSGVTLMKATAADRIFCILPLFHAFAFTVTLVSAPRIGASGILVAKPVPRQMLQQLMDPQLTILLAVPSLLMTLLKFPSGFKLPISFRCVLCGGAGLSPVQEVSFRERFGVPVLQGYGTTECSPLAALNPLYGIQKPGSIGLPMPEGHELGICDLETERLLDNREIGELVVRGPHVFQGYLNQPEATAKVFTPHGWLRTGDLAYRDGDGYYFVVDRIKDMINVSGEKVFSPEVEAAIQAYPGIQESAVVGRPDLSKGEVVCAYLTLAEPIAETKTFIEGLLQHLRQHLAPFKVPKQIEILPEFPRSAAGKILKRVLREKAALSS